MDWYESFLNDLVLKDKESENKIKSRNTYKILQKKLLSDDENVFVEAYPGKEEILKDWSNCTYYRKESAFASQYCSMIGTVIVVLPPYDTDKKFYDYFNIKPRDFVENYINVDGNEFILPLILEADKYKISGVRDVYEPIFKDFKDLGDEKRYPSYANIMQNCLLKEKGITWEEFKIFNINSVECKSYDPVTLGSLPIKDPKNEIGEKVALLRLIKMDGLANDILNLAKIDTDLAVKMCFTANDLYTAPIFYTRKTLKTIASSYDLQIYQTAIKGLTEFKKRSLGKDLTNQIKRNVCYLVSSFKNIGSLDPMEIAVPIPHNEEYQKELPNIMIREGCGELLHEANQKIPELRANLLTNVDKTREVRDEIVKIRNELSDYYFREFTNSGNFMIKMVDTTLGFFSHENVNEILSQFKQLGMITSMAPFAEVLWENKIRMDLEAKCVKSWAEDFLNEYPLLKYNPTIYAWQI
jgi:hypothetical protein